MFQILCKKSNSIWEACIEYSTDTCLLGSGVYPRDNWLGGGGTTSGCGGRFPPECSTSFPLRPHGSIHQSATVQTHCVQNGRGHKLEVWETTQRSGFIVLTQSWTRGPETSLIWVNRLVAMSLISKFCIFILSIKKD